MKCANPEAAAVVGAAAEQHRRDLAEGWLGSPLPRWQSPCVLTVTITDGAADGRTYYSFAQGRVEGWEMTVRGRLQEILDCVLPHEISHTIFASHFRRPLPRWADEGAAMLSEDPAEKRRQRLKFAQMRERQRALPLRKVFDMREYPSTRQEALAFYAQVFSLCDFLIETGGRIEYLTFLNDAEERGWDRAVQRTYGDRNVEGLEQRWIAWVAASGQKQAASPAARETADAAPQVAATAEAGSAAAVPAMAVTVEAGFTPTD